MHVSLQAAALLVASNFFMTYAWYAHLRNMAHWPWYLAALCILGAVYFVFRATAQGPG